jgi:hypothetical protein
MALEQAPAATDGEALNMNLPDDDLRRTIGGNIAELGRVGKGGSALPLPMKSRT